MSGVEPQTDGEQLESGIGMLARLQDHALGEAGPSYLEFAHVCTLKDLKALAVLLWTFG